MSLVRATAISVPERSLKTSWLSMPISPAASTPAAVLLHFPQAVGEGQRLDFFRQRKARLSGMDDEQAIEAQIGERSGERSSILAF